MGRTRLLAGLTALMALLATALLTSAPASAHSTPPGTAPFRCTPPKLLPDLGHGSATIAANRHGTVGGFVVADDGSPHAAIWRDGVLQPRFDPGYLRSF